MRLRLVLWKAERVKHKATDTERERDRQSKRFVGRVGKNEEYLFSGLQGISKLKLYQLLKRLSAMM